MEVGVNRDIGDQAEQLKRIWIGESVGSQAEQPQGI